MLSFVMLSFVSTMHTFFIAIAESPNTEDSYAGSKESKWFVFSR
jgi:hypothetical protein